MCLAAHFPNRGLENPIVRGSTPGVSDAFAWGADYTTRRENIQSVLAIPKDLLEIQAQMSYWELPPETAKWALPRIRLPTVPVELTIPLERN